MALLFQRMMNMLCICLRCNHVLVEDPRSIMNYILDVQPSVFIAVPRFYEKLYEAMRMTSSNRLAGEPPLGISSNS